ncbi:MAG: hypothetical protein JO262_01465 [Solirubrobacterales bacterium]|nr:hypothetical protein [Solirubrobacterales bacterium]MBV9940768.1 hypothetical protein [Solirubrobacterales bacterium]
MLQGAAVAGAVALVDPAGRNPVELWRCT